MTIRSEPLLHYLRRLTARPNSNDGDAVLLERFVADGDESAFAALLARHGPMVLGVCRRVLHNTQDAEDAFQATFLVLARKAASLRRPEALASWLYGTARHFASTARRAAARRRQHETRCLESTVACPPMHVLDDLSARELLLALDEELAALPERYRLPLILCQLEGRTHDEAARLLGWTAGSVKGRLERGRKRLHARLTRRGLELSGATLALGVSHSGLANASARMTSATLQAALAFAHGERGGMAATVLALAETGLTSTVMTKAKLGLVVLLALVLASGTGALVYPGRSEKQPEISKLPKPEMANPARTDLYGDPLPSGALARFGTQRWRHGHQVTAVAFSPNGATLASGSWDGAIHLWDAKTGKLLRILRGHGDFISSVFFTPDGKQLVSCNGSLLTPNTARVWDVATGKELRRWPIPGSWKLALSPDGKLLAGLGAALPNQNTIALWDVGTGKQIRELPFEGVQDFVSDLAFSPDGKRLVSGGESMLRLFDVAKGKQLRTFGEGKRIYSVAFSSDGKTVAVGRRVEPITLWEIASFKMLRQLGDNEGARSVAFSGDGKRLAGGGYGKAILWDVTSGKKLRELPGTLNQVWDMAFSPDDKTLAVGNLDSQVRLWDLSTGKEFSSVGGHRGGVNFLSFIDRDQGIASASTADMVCHWDIATSKTIRKFEEGTWWNCGDLSPDGRTLALRDDAGVHLFDWSTGKKLRLLKGHKHRVISAVFSPKGDVLASSALMDQHIILWDVAAGKELRRILTPYFPHLDSLAWSPDGKILAAAAPQSDTYRVSLWDPSTGKQLREWALQQSKDREIDGERGLAFAPDGKLLAAADGDSTVVVWDVASGRLRARLSGHRKIILALAFSPDGHMLASGGLDRTVRLWELATWKERRVYEGHLGSITKLAFSADGLTLASASSDTSVLLWSVRDRDPRQRQPDLTLTSQQLKNLWDDLASEDASRAWRAVCILTKAPKQTVSWLKEHVKPLSGAELDRIANLIADLDSDQFAVREQAARELEKFGEWAQPALRKALEKHPGLEVRRQLEQLLEKLEGPVRAAGMMRELRSLEVLEHIATPEARQVLEKLAGGSAEARLTQEAKASLARLAARSGVRP